MNKLLVFDVGGTEIKYSLIDDELNITEPGTFPTPVTPEEKADDKEVLEADYDDFLSRIEEIYRKYENEAEGIAMSLPGFIDVKNGRQCGGGAIPSIINREIAKDLSERCGCGVKIANDAKCAAMAEKTRGSLKGCTNAGVFIIGTGVGGGLIIGNEIINGNHFTAGEFSFVRVDIDNEWEDRNNTMGDACSTTGLLNLYKKKKGLQHDEKINGKEFFVNYKEGEKAAIVALDIFCERVAKSILNITFLLDLERVAVGGGISRQEVLIDGIREAVARLWKTTGLVADSSMRQVEIVACDYHNEANQIGAYCYFKEG